jgi:hypothetical protein
MGTMAAGEPPLTGADSPFLGSAHRGSEPSKPKHVAKPGDLTPPEGQTEVCTSPYRVMGRNGTSQEALCPRLIVVAR